MENPTPQQAINRGFQLGFVLFGLFIVSAALIYVTADILGAEGSSKWLYALLCGPVIGSLLFGLWWLIRQSPPSPPSPPSADEIGE